MSPEAKGYAINIPEIKIDKNMEADVVIIGGGGAGLPAALTALEAGAKSVIVLEKRFATGGNALRCNHIFAVGSRIQKEAGSTVSADDILKKALEYYRYDRVNPRLIRTLINRSADTIHWLEGKGIEFKLLHMGPDPDPRNATTLVEKDMPLPDSLCSLGKIFRSLTQQAADAGVLFLLRTRARKIKLGSDGRVTGVLAQTGDDQEIEIKAGAVILSPGGFIVNKELLKKYYPHRYDEVFFNISSPGDTGDGLPLAADAGAAMSNICTFLGYGYSFKTRVNFRHENFPPFTVLVNKRGQRYIDESAFEVSANAIVQQPGKITYALFDDKMVQSITEKETHMQYAARNPTPPEELPEWIRDYRKYLQVKAKNNWVKIADNWAEIAEWIGCDAQNLEATAARYNSFCEQGYDDDFAKQPRHLVPLTTPPYYAVHYRPLWLETVGPVIVNEHMEVMDKQAEPISGFFAAGVITSGWASHDYGGTPPGSAMSFTLTSGRIAGESAARYVLGK
jgi:fumarate reductase flavoprotein subunit